MVNRFCEECGAKLPDVARFCPFCGTSVAFFRQQAITRDYKEPSFDDGDLNGYKELHYSISSTPTSRYLDRLKGTREDQERQIWQQEQEGARLEEERKRKQKERKRREMDDFMKQQQEMAKHNRDSMRQQQERARKMHENAMQIARQQQERLRRSRR